MQQINLITALKKPEKSILPAAIILKIFLGLLLVLGIVTAGSCTQLWLDKRHLQQVNAEKEQAEKALVHIANKHPKVMSEEALIAHIADLQIEVDHKEKTLKQFSQSAQLRGFATYLEALSTYTPYGIWLEQIIINASTNDIRLIGNTTIPAQIPNYIEQLAESEFFEHNVFQVFAINRSDKGNFVAFSLGSLDIERQPNQPSVSLDKSSESQINQDSMQELLRSEQQTVDLINRVIVPQTQSQMGQ